MAGWPTAAEARGSVVETVGVAAGEKARTGSKRPEMRNHSE